MKRKITNEPDQGDDPLPTRPSRPATRNARGDAFSTRSRRAGVVHRPALRQWSGSELREMAELLGIARPGDLDREALIDVLSRSGRRRRYH